MLYLIAEDGLADTLRPRFDSLGGNAGRFFVLRGVVVLQGDVEHRGAVTLGDVALLEEAIEKYTPAMVVVDPLQAYLGAGVDMHKANEVRPILANLTRLAEKYRCAILLIRHLSKASQLKVMYRG